MRHPSYQPYHVYFNGECITYAFYASDLRMQGMPVDIGSIVVPGRDGALFTGATLGPKTISMRLTAVNSTLAERREEIGKLFKILHVSEPKKLAFLFDDANQTLFYMAVPTSINDLGLFKRHTSVDVQFKLLDPVMYGTQKTVNIASGGSATFTVKGNYPTRPTITSSAAKNGSGGYWRLRKNNSQTDMQDFILNVPSASAVSADCEKRTLTVAGSTAMLDPSADWLVLNPGSNTIAMTGTGATTITYYERWLR